ncbi:MAG: hypothetical protein ACQEUZ_04230 [Pseudomonadota bacterium]
MSLFSGKRILVVEDEAAIALSLEDMLDDLGAVVVGPAASVETGLALLEAGPVDGGLLDVNLGGRSCLPIARALSARGAPYIYATGYGAVARESGDRAPVVEKPYDREGVADALARAFGARRPDPRAALAEAGLAPAPRGPWGRGGGSPPRREGAEAPTAPRRVNPARRPRDRGRPCGRSRRGPRERGRGPPRPGGR